MAGEKKFFLGVGGQQTGPYSEQEINEKIQAGEAKPDTLVWYEGLGEWQRVDTIAYFQPAFKHRKPSAPGSPSGFVKSSSAAPPDSSPRPVFSSKEAVFFRRKGPRPEVLVGGILVMIGLGVWYWQVNSEESEIKVDRHITSKKEHLSRYDRLKKAEADYLLKPSTIPPEYLELVRENAADEWGVKSVKALEALYKKRHLNTLLGELYSLVGRHEEAVEAFLEDKAYPQAEQSAFKGYHTAADPKLKRAMLIKSIELLVGPAMNMPLALARIAILDKEFPNESHPFAYYLLPPEKKMVDLFNRSSFFFVEGLVNHLKAEFPQMKLGGRPVAALLKEGPDKFRIVGTYKGEVVLNYDKLKAIRFEYWLVGSDWNLVSTNVTNERAVWAKNNRMRYTGSVLSGEALLKYLESVMRNQFPRLGLHEKISRQEMQSAARETSSRR